MKHYETKLYLRTTISNRDESIKVRDKQLKDKKLKIAHLSEIIEENKKELEGANHLIEELLSYKRGLEMENARLVSIKVPEGLENIDNEMLTRIKR